MRYSSGSFVQAYKNIFGFDFLFFTQSDSVQTIFLSQENSCILKLLSRLFLAPSISCYFQNPGKNFQTKYITSTSSKIRKGQLILFCSCFVASNFIQKSSSGGMQRDELLNKNRIRPGRGGFKYFTFQFWQRPDFAVFYSHHILTVFIQAHTGEIDSGSGNAD